MSIRDCHPLSASLHLKRRRREGSLESRHCTVETYFGFIVKAILSSFLKIHRGLFKFPHFSTFQISTHCRFLLTKLFAVDEFEVFKGLLCLSCLHYLFLLFDIKSIESALKAHYPLWGLSLWRFSTLLNFSFWSFVLCMKLLDQVDCEYYQMRQCVWVWI